MPPAVEARSLSSLTTLAANPPLYPRNPTQEIQQPLILYIARVPGSKDVFLTTLKPRERVVTVEDIQSSLYYLHVDDADNDHFLADLDNAQPSQEVDEARKTQGRNKENRPEVFRKPLQHNPQPVWCNGEESPLSTYPYHQSSTHTPQVSVPLKRKPLSSTARFEGHQRRETSIGAAAQSPAKQLLGPRPYQSRARTSQRDQPSAEKQLPELPREPTASSPTPSGTAQHYLGLHRQRSSSWSGSTATNELSLTLIRRDPASGGQWNVGKILGVPLGEVDPNGGHTSPNKSMKPIRRPLDVEVRTPGYVKFKSASSQTVETGPHQNNTFTGSRQYESTANRGAVRDDGTFRRRISFGQSVLSQYKPWERRPGSSELSDGSLMSGEIFDSNITRGTHNIEIENRISAGHLDLPPSETKSKAQGYTFLSPWNGTCEFLTGVSGKSLICKHRLGQGVAATAPSPAVTVSELRFNLPSSGLFHLVQPNASTQSATRKHNRLSFISKYKHRRQLSSESGSHSLPPDEAGSVTKGSSSDGSDADESKLDLSLGQEHAGGGFGGRQAKLGKLIIEDEGLKMLDLLVAANMGLWWHVYERCMSP